MSSSAAALTVPLAVCSCRRTGAATARTLTD
jgi:hypothetical protein